jgi:hypothetical protein
MKSRENDSSNAHLVTGDIKILTESLTVVVLGTLAASLAVQHPSLLSPAYGAPSIECSDPASALPGVTPSFSEEKAFFDQVSRIFHAVL